MDKLKEIVTWQVRRLDKVRSTITMIVSGERRYEIENGATQGVIKILPFFPSFVEEEGVAPNLD